MSTDYNYDEQGQFFPFFILTLTGLVTLPMTYNVLKPSKELESTAPRIKSDFRPEHADLIDKQRWKQKRRHRKLKRMITATAGWLLMAWMVYLIAVTARTTAKIWDPYDILGLSRSASEKQIKSQYRKLSLTQHPDKVRLDPTLNETVESANDRWVEIIKAFKTLTDEDIRNNYIQYGHPDGKQSFSIGIALPKFIVTRGNGKYVLLLYGSLLGVLLPWMVGKWWYGTQNMTRDGILVASAGKLFTEYREDMGEGAVVGALSNGEEFQEKFRGSKGEEGLSRVENKILAGEEQAYVTLTGQDRDKLSKMEDERKRKALGLLWAYLGRVDLEYALLNEQKYAVAPIAFALNESFTTMALAYANLQPLLASYHASQNLVQALAPGASPLLQLPYFTRQVIQAIEDKAGRRYSSVQNFMSVPDQQRRKLSVGTGLLTEENYRAAVQVASQLPVARVEEAFFKVIGERFLTPGSLIQFVVKVRIIPPGLANVPEVNELDLEDVDAKEGDLDALHGRKKPKVKTADGKVVTETAEAVVQPPLAHAPYFPQDHSPRWRVFLADSKQGKVAVPPFTFSTFDKPLFNENGSPTCNVQTLKMQFQAPPQAGNYLFTMHLVCDSYIGMDSTKDVVMVIEEMSRAEEIEDDEEISEPEEDSIAGQMAALKGGDTAGTPTTKRKVRKPVEDESSDGSNTEGEEGSESDSDTDTDTDNE